MKNVLKLGLAGALAFANAAPALAQYQSGTPYQPTPQYQRDVQDYQDQQDDYQDQQEDYARARADYQRRLDDYNRARDAYERRYGPGSYARYYGPPPNWDSAYWDRRDPRNSDRYDRNGYERSYGDRDRDYADRNYDPCRERTSGNTAAGAIIGALAGAAIGSNVAARNARPEGAVLGAVVGGVAGGAIGRSSTKCDAGGYYFTYDQTVPYRESDYDRYRRSGRYDYAYYSSHRCRLAPAPINDRGDDVRYVRVCPDSQGRYRITD